MRVERTIKPQLLTISEVAEFVGDTEDNIQGFIREDRAPYIVLPDGILIPFHAFQACMNDLYDLEGDLRAIEEAIKDRNDV